MAKQSTKQTYDIGGIKVRAESTSSANKLAAEIAGDRAKGLSAGGSSAGQNKFDSIQTGADKITGETGGATNPGKGFVSSSDKVVADERSTASLVAGLSAPDPNYDEAKKASDSYMKTLDDYYKTLAEREKNDVMGINASYAQATKDTMEEQNKERGTTSVALARTGGYLGTSISGVGVLNNQAQQHRSEIAALDVKRLSAIQEAKNAIAEKKFAVAKEKGAEAKSLASEINKRRQDFFTNSLNLLQEGRAQEKQMFDRADRVAVTIANDIQDMDEKQSQEYIASAAKEIGIDTNILMGSINAIAQEEREKIQQAVLSLSSKYPSAGISPSDDWMTAQSKVRGSREYTLDVAKAEQDLVNSRRAGQEDAAVDFGSPILRLFAETTGKFVDSKGTARAVESYAGGILSGKEIVSDDTPIPALTPGRIRESEAKKLLSDSFSVFAETASEVPDDEVWRWTESAEAQAMDDGTKSATIRGVFGKNPADFGLYEGLIKF